MAQSLTVRAYRQKYNFGIPTILMHLDSRDPSRASKVENGHITDRPLLWWRLQWEAYGIKDRINPYRVAMPQIRNEDAQLILIEGLHAMSVGVTHVCRWLEYPVPPFSLIHAMWFDEETDAINAKMFLDQYR